MNSNTVVSKLDRFFDEELQSNLKNILITTDNKGTYSLFGRFSITSLSKGLYNVIEIMENSHQFSTLKNAIAWCILTNNNMYSEAERISVLDMKLSSVQTDLEAHRKKLNLALTKDSRNIYITKIQEDTRKKRIIVAEIYSYLTRSHKIQNTNFNKESNFKYQ